MTRVVALLLGVAGCIHATPSCLDAGRAVGRQIAQTDELGPTIAARCEADGWSPATRRCVVAIDPWTTEAAMKQCVATLTAAQIRSLETRLGGIHAAGWCDAWGTHPTGFRRCARP